MSDDKKINGTSDMPPVEVLDYNKTFKVSDLFLNDLKITLKDVAYADAIPYFNYLAKYNYILPVAILNEFLKMLSNLPIKYVAPLFAVIQNKELFSKYFVDITPDNKQENTPEKKETKNA